MSIFPLEIFPAGSLANSVITTVWVGVAVTAFFNLRFGWVLSGLVVPGYLVPLMIVRPWSAGAVVIEAILTYLLVWLFSERASRAGGWSSLFGRDRFFALLLASVGVRVLADGWGWPIVADLLEAQGFVDVDFRANLQSFGLVIIALMANQFWKPGLIRGAFPMVVTIGITYLITRYGLMEFTNFAMSNVAYMYEDMAASILASPKAYIILVVTAFIASRMNLLYGWEFSGILLPALLALQWYQPGKVVTTFVESFVILFAARAVLASPLFAGSSIQGARKLLLFFNIGFAYKLLLGYALLWFAPEVKATDYFGFGYLFATLLAVKMHDKEIAAGLTRATLQTSLVAVLIASALGFVLSRIPSLGAGDHALAAIESPVLRVEQDLLERVRQDKVLLYQPRGPNASAQPTSQQIDRFEAALRRLDRPDILGDKAALAEAAAQLHLIGYRLSIVDGRYLYLHESALGDRPSRAWGTFVFDPASTSRLTIEVPAAGAERGTNEAGVMLLRRMNGRGLALAGGSRGSDPERPTGALMNPQSLFQAFHRTVAGRDVLQLRRYTSDAARSLLGERRDAADLDRPEPPPILFVRNRLPDSLDLPLLKGLIDQVEVRFAVPPFENRQRAETPHGFAELLLDTDGLRRMRARGGLSGREVQPQTGERRIDGYISEYLFSGKAQIAARGSDDYRPAQVEELMFWDEEIVAPMVHLVREQYRDRALTPEGKQDFAEIAAQAAVFGYQLVYYRHAGSGEDFAVLSERADAVPRRHWGTFVLRMGEAPRVIVEVPRPLFEVGSFEYGATLFERIDGQALLLAGAHPAANRDGSADVLLGINKLSLFNLFNQVLVREARGDETLIVQTRGFGYREDGESPQGDAVLAFGDGTARRQPLSPLVARLDEVLEADGIDVQDAVGASSSAGYEAGAVAQSRYLEAASNARFAVLRLSPLSRFAFRQQSENRQQIAQFEALQIPTRELDLPRHLQTRTFSRDLPAGFRDAMRRYQVVSDIVTLRQLQREYPQWTLARLIDRDTQQSFLSVEAPDGRLAGVFNLRPRQPLEAMSLAPGAADGADASAVLERFIYRGAALLEAGGRQP